MKNLFIIIFLTLVIKVGAQTVLEQTYASAGYYGSTNSQQQLYVVKLEVDGNKFAFVDKANLPCMTRLMKISAANLAFQ